jgi:hypothetical protein
MWSQLPPPHCATEVLFTALNRSPRKIMPDISELQLACPLFVFALIMINAKWQAHKMVSAPPKVQSIMGYTNGNCTPAASSSRKRNAMTVAKLAAQIFNEAGVVAPAGLLSWDPKLPLRLDKMPSWVYSLAQLNHREALAMLAEMAPAVPEAVYRQV